MTHPLLAYRRQQELSQDDLAKQLETTGATISRIESGARAPSHKLALRIEQVTGISRQVLRPDIYEPQPTKPKGKAA